MISGQIVRLKTNEEFGNIIAQNIIDIAKNCIINQNKYFMAVSGGNTPLSVFKILSNIKYRNILDWSKVHIFFIDERCVPADHVENNFKSCYELWLQYYPEIKYHRIESWLDPEEAARLYEKEIETTMKINSRFPKFDLIFLGIGEDGHIASLFPDYNFEKNVTQYVESVYVKAKNINRVTMTLPILNNAKNRIIGIVGDKKKKIFTDLMNSDYNDYPVAKLLSSEADDIWVLN